MEKKIDNSEQRELNNNGQKEINNNGKEKGKQRIMEENLNRK